MRAQRSSPDFSPDTRFVLYDTDFMYKRNENTFIFWMLTTSLWSWDRFCIVI